MFLPLATAIIACSPPKDMAVSNSNFRAGTVYSGRLERITPIYVPSYSYSSYAEIAQSTGRLMGRRTFRNNIDEQQLSELAGLVGGAAMREFEDGNNFTQCNYFIHISDRALANEINPNAGSYSNDGGLRDAQLDEALTEARQTIYRLEEEVRSLETSIANGEAVIEKTDYLESLKALMDERENFILRVESTREAETAARNRTDQQVSIINPCRSFEIQDEIAIISYGYEYVLEKL
jgi:hypothetical protein